MGSDARSIQRQVQEHIAGAISSQKGLADRRQGIRNLNASLNLSERNAPPLFGAGLIDGVPESVLRETVEAQPVHARGRIHRLKDGQVGRFGWKAQTPSLRDFVFAACANELGLEIPDRHQAASPLDVEPGRAKGLDLSADECNALVIYVSMLPVPAAIEPSGLKGSAALGRGRMLFASVGCATCHTPRLGDVDGIYSDLLLHDMGQGLSDSGNYYGQDDPESPGAPKGPEWRTPPLWAFRDTAPYLHDGRARTLQEAVAFHGGQGEKSARQFFALSPLEQFQVLSFLRSLVAPGPSKTPEDRLALAAARDVERRQLDEDLRLGVQIDEAYRSAQQARRQAEERAERATRRGRSPPGRDPAPGRPGAGADGQDPGCPRLLPRDRPSPARFGRGPDGLRADRRAGGPGRRCPVRRRAAAVGPGVLPTGAARRPAGGRPEVSPGAISRRRTVKMFKF